MTRKQSVEVHGLVLVHLWSLYLLGLKGRPLGHKIDLCLGLNSHSGDELKIELLELYCLLSCSSYCIPIVENFSNQERGDYLDFVVLKVVSELVRGISTMYSSF